jgi:hypothetical protein
MSPYFMSLATAPTRANINTGYETVRIQVLEVATLLRILLLIKERKMLTK